MGAHNIKAKIQAKAHPEDHIADVTPTFAAGSIDTGTDMTAAEAAAIVTDIAALATAVNAINAAQASWGITKSS
jgi:hypothetical protein